jgi:TPR repeat protein
MNALLPRHADLWFDDPWYRAAWLVWPQAITALAILWLMVLTPAREPFARWAQPAISQARWAELDGKRNLAKTSQAAMADLADMANAGDPIAQFYLGTLYDPELKFSQLVAPDVNKAIDLYGKAAQFDILPAQNNLASFYFAGTYVKGDFRKACFWAQKVGGNGTGWVVSRLGDCYASGSPSTPIDLAKAVQAYEAARNKGDASAPAKLGYYYQRGEGGLAPNPSQAVTLFRQAADKGDPLGLHNLGAAYDAGIGTVKDPREAARFIFMALERRSEVTVQSLTARPAGWTSELWRELQLRLIERGLYAGPPDGRPNQAVFDAVRKLAGKP